MTEFPHRFVFVPENSLYRLIIPQIEELVGPFNSTYKGEAEALFSCCSRYPELTILKLPSTFTSVEWDSELIGDGRLLLYAVKDVLDQIGPTRIRLRNIRGYMIRCQYIPIK